MKTRGLLSRRQSFCRVVAWFAAVCALSLEAGAAAACPPGWQGAYEWFEAGPRDSGMFWSYDIAVSEKNGRCEARIQEDGYQTMSRLLADVRGDANEIRLLYRDTLPDDMFGNKMRPGTLLLRLQRRGQGLVTHWGAVTAKLEQHEKSGVYFKRTKAAKKKARGKR